MPDLHWFAQQVVAITGGRLSGDGNPRVTSVVTDSRGDVSDALYIALRGERFDGHTFLKDVDQNGAAAAVVETPIEDLSLVQIVVKDTLEAFHKLAAARRRDYTGPLVGITGSSGKTTTRKLVSSILSRSFNVHQPVKNFNNHIGVPLTLLDLEQKHSAAVLELGCSDFGEIELLTKISNPDIALVTNVGPAHLEKLGDLNGVARAKGELFLWSNPDGVAVINLDDPAVASMPVKAKRRITFGCGEKADVRLRGRKYKGLTGQHLLFDVKGEPLEADLPLLGVHNAANALAAVAVAVAMGISNDDIIVGLAAVQQEPGRLALLETPAKSLLVDDTYNANPASTRAAISVLEEISQGGRSVAVIGDMLELGDCSESEHLEVGRFIGSSSIDILITMGQKAKFVNQGAGESGMPGGRRRSVASHSEAASLIRELAGEGDTVLVKGSRGMKMDLIISEIEKGAC